MQIADKTSTLDAVHGDLWKSLRKNMSPTFTSGKLKGMLAPMGEVIDKFLVHIGKAAETKEAVEVKPLFEGTAYEHRLGSYLFAYTTVLVYRHRKSASLRFFI